jgi:leucyl/phenylalanyl-tRNA--protein transferase
MSPPQADEPDFGRFPPIGDARGDGLLAIGGDLTVPRLLSAYRQGIFPWPITWGDQDILAWFCPDPRAVLELDRFHVSRRLARRIRQGGFRITVNQRFAQVIAECAAPRAAEQGTWITPDLVAAYIDLHRCGYAHSVEVVCEEKLVGGVYGVAVGGCFAGESMFHRRRDASKIALFYLVQRLQQRGFLLFDVQQASPHLLRMGAQEIPRAEYLRRLDEALGREVTFV